MYVSNEINCDIRKALSPLCKLGASYPLKGVGRYLYVSKTKDIFFFRCNVLRYRLICKSHFRAEKRELKSCNFAERLLASSKMQVAL